MNVFLNHVFLNHANAFPFALRWNAQELADAVPLRLHEAVRFDAQALRAANAAPVAPRRGGIQNGYLRRNDMPEFVRIR